MTKVTSKHEDFKTFPRSLMTADLPLIKSLLTPLPKSVSIPLGLSTRISVADAATQKKIYELGRKIALIISNKEMKNIMKIIKLLEELGLLRKRIRETIKNEAKNEEEDFFQCY